MRKFILQLSWITLLISPLAQAAQLNDWQEVIRRTPYWVSQGAFNNLATIRQWVLTGTSYCEATNRHILFDRRAQFLSYFSDGKDPQATQNLLNQYRQEFADTKRVKYWVPGGANTIGYPFALSCNQPLANLNTAYRRYTGKIKSAKLWGTWDGMRIGSATNTVSLKDALQQVYNDRSKRNRITLPEDILATLAGKILIESGGRAKAHSARDAKGIMQLSPLALKDCGLAKKFHFHRMAQIDCAFQLLEQNHRLLKEPFEQAFSKLPKQKQESLYASLLIQAYHGGIGRISALLTDPELNKPALYFAQHHENFSAGDIALGMIFHNLGRNQLGFASLYYVVDVGVATAYACRRAGDLPGC